MYYVYGLYLYKWEDSDITAKSFKEDLDALGRDWHVEHGINSPGGSVFWLYRY